MVFIASKKHLTQHNNNKINQNEGQKLCMSIVHLFVSTCVTMQLTFYFSSYLQLGSQNLKKKLSSYDINNLNCVLADPIFILFQAIDVVEV